MAATATAGAATATGHYVPSPMEVGWEAWVGFVAGVVPFIIGSWEFAKRIVSVLVHMCDGPRREIMITTTLFGGMYGGGVPSY